LANTCLICGSADDEERNVLWPRQQENQGWVCGGPETPGGSTIASAHLDFPLLHGATGGFRRITDFWSTWHSFEWKSTFYIFINYWGCHWSGVVIFNAISHQNIWFIEQKYILDRCRKVQMYKLL